MDKPRLHPTVANREAEEGTLAYPENARRQLDGIGGAQ
jgi:hypothetical protein